MLSMATDNQPTVTIHAFESERALSKDQNLARFVLNGIFVAPCGAPKIGVTVEIDPNISSKSVPS